jgi:hypothetical protein
MKLRGYPLTKAHDSDRGANTHKFRRSRRGDQSNPTVSEFFVAQAISSRKLKRELRAHLSLRMHWKIIYGTNAMTVRAPAGRLLPANRAKC